MPGTVAQQKPVQRNVTFHAFNADQSLVALSPNSDEVWIYKTNGKNSDDWDKEPSWKLTEHGGFISGIAWHGESNTLVTAGHDRNAYVWKFADNEWKPTLVILRINRAATDVKWSPNGKKFAVTSGAKCVPICHFEESNDWWISKMVKKHKSTVTSVAWSPNSKYIITGACDFKARVFSTFIEGLDEAADDQYTSMWADKQHSFGEELVNFDATKAWVNDVSWSPNGMRLAFAGQGSSIHFVHLQDGSKKGNLQTIFQKNLPFLKVGFLNDDSLVAVGFDNNPHVYVSKGSDAEPAWELLDKADDEKKEEPKAAKKKGFGSAFSKFQQADSRGQKFGKATAEKECLTKHKNTVYDLKVLDAKKFSTSGMDGRVLTWDLSSMSGL